MAKAGLAHPRAAQDMAAAVAAGHRVARAAAATLHQAGKQVHWPDPLARFLRSAADVARGLYLVPQRLVDDAQVRRFSRHPLVSRIEPTDAAAGFRIFREGLPVVDDATDIEFVLQDAILSLAAAVDRRGVPRAAARARHAFAVQLGGDRARRNPSCVTGEDPAHHFRLFLDDLQFALPAGDHAVAVRSAAVVPAIGQHASLAAPRLVGEILQVHRAEQALDADMHRSGDAIMRGADIDSGKLKPFVDAGEILLVARQAIERLGHHDLELAARGVAHQALHAKAVVQRCAGDGAIVVYRDHDQALGFADAAAQGDLVVDRAVGLFIGAESRVNRGRQRRGRWCHECPARQLDH